MGQIVFGITYVGIKFMFTLPRKGANAVERLNIDELQSFMSEPVGVTIYDETWGDQTPFMSKKIEKAELSPGGTHLRIYVDQVRVFAVTLGGDVTITATWGTAYGDNKAIPYEGRKGIDYSVKT